MLSKQTVIFNKYYVSSKRVVKQSNKLGGTLNIAACHITGPMLVLTSWPELTDIPCFSSSMMPQRCTLKRARYGAFAALKNMTNSIKQE